MNRNAVLVSALGVIWAAWLAVVPFESPQSPVNCGAAILRVIDAGELTRPDCRAAAQVAVVVLTASLVVARRRDQLLHLYRSWLKLGDPW
jgi:hypothetical protein